LQDSVPLNLADGGFDMQAIEPQATRYIEVERGANALRYGGSTLGGAINYVSETGRSSPALSLRAEVGAFAYQRYNISAGAAKGALDAYASANFQEQDGFRDHARQRNARVVGNVGVQLSPQLESRTYVTIVDTDSELPGNLTYAQLKANPRQASARSEARDQHRDFVLYRLANRMHYTHDNGNISEASVFLAKKRLYHPIEFFPTGPGVLEQDSRDWGVGLRHSANTQWAGKRQQHVVGAQWRHGLTDDERHSYANNVFVPGQGFAVGQARGALDHRQKQSADNIDLYGQTSWDWSPSLTTVTGLQSSFATRRQTVEIDNNGIDVATGAMLLPTGSYEEGYQRTSPKIGLIYRPAQDTEIYTNVSGSFEPPSFSETLNSTPLKAQRAMTAELGARGHRQVADAKLGWDVSLYRAHIRHELLTLAVGTASATINADKAVHQGIEFGLSARANNWRAQASYLYNDFHFVDDSGAGNNTIAGVPDHVLNAEAAVKLPGNVWLGPTVQSASRAWVDHKNTLKAPGYSIYGIKLNQSLSDGFAWFVEGRNVGDKRYASTTGVIFNANSTDQAQFSPGDGRAVYAGVSKAF
ncbi:MAG: TonB-dependent receptor, partial [Paraperlucidibaca sp.]